MCLFCRCISTVMEWHSLGHVEDTYMNFDNPVKLIRFDVTQDINEPEDNMSQIRNVYTEFDSNPLNMLRTSMEPLPSYVDVIVGHSVVSTSAAIQLRTQMYPNSKVCCLLDNHNSYHWRRPHRTPSPRRVGWGPQLIQCFLSYKKFPLQTGSWFIQPFLQSARMRYRLTDRRRNYRSQQSAFYVFGAA